MTADCLGGMALGISYSAESVAATRGNTSLILFVTQRDLPACQGPHIEEPKHPEMRLPRPKSEAETHLWRTRHKVNSSLSCTQCTIL